MFLPCSSCGQTDKSQLSTLINRVVCGGVGENSSRSFIASDSATQGVQECLKLIDSATSWMMVVSGSMMVRRRKRGRFGRRDSATSDEQVS